eukprot:5948397-Prymnesium_polylepis.1
MAVGTIHHVRKWSVQPSACLTGRVSRASILTVCSQNVYYKITARATRSPLLAIAQGSSAGGRGGVEDRIPKSFKVT